MNNGFVKVAVAIPQIQVANCTRNATQILNLYQQAAKEQADLVCFPELCLTGYSCQDLFTSPQLIVAAENQLGALLHATQEVATIAVVGLPVAWQGRLFNAAAVIQRGKVLAVAAQSQNTPHKGFAENRWFANASDVREQIWLCGQKVTLTGSCVIQVQEKPDAAPAYTFGVQVGEDFTLPQSNATLLTAAGAEIILNPTAIPATYGQTETLRTLTKAQSARLKCAYLVAGASPTESTQDVVFSGTGLILENGEILGENTLLSWEKELLLNDIDVAYLRSERQADIAYRTCIQSQLNAQAFENICTLQEPADKTYKLHRVVNPHPFEVAGEMLSKQCAEILQIQVMGLAKRLIHTHCQNVVLGISGGLDSTLALLVAVQTMDFLQYPRTNIFAITMPGFGTTGRTRNNATILMEQLGVSSQSISIVPACQQHFEDIQLNANERGAAYENSQARERTQILLDIANKTNAIVVGTGDLSELALGWATYNGDHMSNYAVNASIPKTLVRQVVLYVARNIYADSIQQTLLDIIDTPISPELLPADAQDQIQQKTEDLVGPYELHDFFLFHFLQRHASPQHIFFLAKHAFQGKYTEEVIRHWLSTFLRRFFTQQFKRSCSPDGAKVGTVSLSPRTDWMMPSDADNFEWQLKD